MSKSPSLRPPPDKTASIAEREAYWRSHLDGWRASGLSQSVYSQRHGLRANQLSYWHRRDQRLTAKAASKPPAPTADHGGFIPVQVVTPPESEALSVRLPTGVGIEGITEANLTVVGQLLAQL